ncbi:MAG: hypothetical protein ACT4P6_14235 [Gemmatimonadaceae bacterium]
MKAVRLTRAQLPSLQPDGLVLTQDVRDSTGGVIASKGTRLTDVAIERLATVDWSELHAIQLEAQDVHEIDAGGRLARAVAGTDVDVGTMTAGHWPLLAAARGVVHVDVAALRAINTLGGIALYTLFDGQVVDQRETVARGKIVPFAVPDRALRDMEEAARVPNGVVHIRRFVPTLVGAVIQESLGDRATTRAHAVLGEKLAWFGSTLRAPSFVTPSGDAIATALRDQVAGGAQLLIVAGSRAMDPLDPVFAALTQLEARLERQGMPAHPGSLLWLAYLSSADGAELPVVGLPSCGLFSQASLFDLLLPRILTGARLTADSLAEFGHGGLLTRDMQFRFPPYRSGMRRGEVLEE